MMGGGSRGLVAVEWRVQRRYGIPPVVLGLAAVWAAAVAATDAPGAAPYAVFIDVMTIGTVVAGALTVLDRSTGVAAALRVTPTRPVERIAARLGCLAALSTAGAAPVLVAGATPAARLPAVLTAVALGTVLLAAIGLAVAPGARTLIGFLTRAPWPLLPLLGVPLAVGAGLLDGVGWFAIPTTGVLALLRGAAAPPAWLVLGYLALWGAAAVWFAARDRPVRSSARRHRVPGTRRAWGRFGYVRADASNVARDSVLVPVVASPLLLGLALRFGYPPARSWLLAAHGFDLDAYRPVIALLVVVLHVPLIFGMVGALLVLDDADDGVLRVVRVSALGAHRYLGYRLGAVTVATAAGLAVAAPLSGLVPAAAWPAAALAVPIAPLFMLAVLASAAGRVGGITASKALGLLVHAPLAAWWLTGPAGWLLAPLPAFWVVRAYADPASGWYRLGGTLVAVAWLTALARHVDRKLGGQASTQAGTRTSAK